MTAVSDKVKHNLFSFRERELDSLAVLHSFQVVRDVFEFVILGVERVDCVERNLDRIGIRQSGELLVLQDTIHVVELVFFQSFHLTGIELNFDVGVPMRFNALASSALENLLFLPRRYHADVAAHDAVSIEDAGQLTFRSEESDSVELHAQSPTIGLLDDVVFRKIVSRFDDRAFPLLLVHLAQGVDGDVLFRLLHDGSVGANLALIGRRRNGRNLLEHIGGEVVVNQIGIILAAEHDDSLASGRNIRTDSTLASTIQVIVEPFDVTTELRLSADTDLATMVATLAEQLKIRRELFEEASRFSDVNTLPSNLEILV